MRLMKAVICMLLMTVVTFSLAGCSFTSGFKVDEDGNIIIKDKDNEGNEVVIGEKKWDKSKMHGLSAPNARLETSLISQDGAMYGFSEMKESDAKDYIDAIKAAGFTYSSITLDDYMYNGTNKEGLTINFMYDKDSGTGSIMSSKGDIPSEDENEGGAVIGSGNQKWDSEKMGGLPDPGVKIGAFWTADGDSYYNLEAIPSFADYVKKIKDQGFTEGIEETEINDLYIFTASNKGGDRITFSVSEDITTIIFEKAD